MALGLELKGQFSTDSPLSTQLTEEGFKAFVENIQNGSNGWRLIGQCSSKGAMIQAQVHSGVEDLLIQVSDSRIMIRFKSTPAGPGYHITAVAFIDYLTKACNIQWLNTAEADNSAYFANRDKAVLERAFVDWLRGLCQFAKDNPKDHCVSMDLPHGLQVEADGFFATPMGPRDAKWLDEIIEDCASHVLDYYSWWEAEKNVSYYQGVSLLLGWNLVAWRRPNTHKEAQVMTDFVEACEKAVSLQSDIQLPRQAWVECCNYLERDIPKEALKQDEIGALGYRRGLIHYPIGAGWSVCLPGNFSQEVGEKSVWRGWSEGKELKVQIFPLKRVGAVEEILPRLKQPSPGERFNTSNSETGFYGVGDMYRTEDQRLKFEGEFLSGDTVMSMSATIPADEEAWMKGVWESIQRK